MKQKKVYLTERALFYGIESSTISLSDDEKYGVIKDFDGNITTFEIATMKHHDIFLDLHDAKQDAIEKLNDEYTRLEKEKSRIFWIMSQVRKIKE